MAFARVQRRRMRDQIEELLRREIQVGTILPGERLPAISQIAQETGASYRTVQQALVALQQQGLVDLRHGAGTYVCQQERSMSLADTVLLCMDPQAHVYGELHGLLAAQLQARHLLSATVAPVLAADAEAMQRVAASRFRGLIIHGQPSLRTDLLPTRSESGGELHVVSVLGFASQLHVQHRNIHCVVVDHIAGSALVRDFLLARGHRRVLMVGPQNMLSHALQRPGDRRRCELDFHMLAAAGISQVSLRVITDPAPRMYVEPAEVAAVFAQAEPPTAVVGMRDVDVHILQRELLQQFPGRSLDLIGYGNTPHSSLSLPAFSTIDWNLHEVAERAVELLVAGADQPWMPGITYVRPRLITR